MPKLFGRSATRYAVFRWVLPRLGCEPLVNMNLAQRGWPVVAAQSARGSYAAQAEEIDCDFDEEASSAALNSYAQRSCPVVLRNYTDPWSLEHVKEEIGHTTGRVRVGDYACEVGDPENVQMRVSKFIDYLNGAADFPHPERLVDGLGPYLANEQIPALASKLPCPDFFLEPPVTSFWLGADSFTPLHSHPMCDVLLVQLTGTRSVILVPPHQAPLVGHVARTIAVHTAEFNPFEPDPDSFPGTDLITSVRADVEAGDALLIPGFWFHAVRLKGASLSGSQFNEARMPMAVGGGPRIDWTRRDFQRGWG